ncbi:MAG TPA: hypothetical protein VM324_08535 [Egibacteraceae bacterium]|nr:hypothetical protein [Egibacteraceae bacterium]
MAELTPARASLRGRIAANVRWSREDPTENVRRANVGFQARFLDEVDPNRELPEAERERRAKAAMRAYMCQLALRSSKARAARKRGEAA